MTFKGRAASKESSRHTESAARVALKSDSAQVLDAPEQELWSLIIDKWAIDQSELKM